MKLNIEQDKISNPHFDVIACAGAGTGKTTVLAKRFLRYVDETNAGNLLKLVKKCCAITFTDKAANQMRERIFEYAFQEFRKAGDKHWFDIYRSLEFAQISTIHSFCRSLIAQDPLEAKIEPNFNIEPQEIPAEEYTEEFLSYLLDNTPRIDEKILWMIKKLGRKNIKISLTEMFKRRQYLGNAVSKLAKAAPDDIQKEYLNFINEQIKKFTNPIIERLNDFLKSPTRESINNDLLAKIQNIVQKFDIDEKIIYEIGAALKGKTISKAPHLVAIREMIKDFQKNYNPDLDYNELDEIAHLSVELAKLYIEFEKYIWMGYDRESTIDFNEMLIKASNLIEKLPDELARKIYPQNLLVDEFQDTSPIQWEIIRKLADFADSVMFVGDEKQSIFRFRGADVSVIRKGEKYINSRSDDKKSSEPFPLNINYRTSKRLLENLDRIFLNSFPAETIFDFEARFQGLEPAPCSDSDGILWLINPDISDEHGKTPEFQEHIIGDIIKTGIDKGIPDSIGRNFSDYLVLATSREKVFDIIKYLRKLGIPAIPLVNSDFYSTSEIELLQFFVDFLADTRRNSALFSLMTHSIFDVNIELIAECLGTETDIFLWDRLKIFYEQHKNQSDEANENKLVRAYEKLSTFITELEKKTIGAILDKFLAEPDVLAKLISESPDVQWANIQKYLYHIYELCADGLNITEISEILLAEKDANKTGFASPTETVNVVRVSTIHSAKGLEANTVIVCDRARRGNDWSRQVNFYTEPEIPYMFVPKIPNSNNKLFWLIKKITSLKNEAESERLFYVAFTRAREHLFIVPVHNGGDKNSFFSKTLSALDGKYDKKNMEIYWNENSPDGVKILNASRIWYPQQAEKMTEYSIDTIKKYADIKIIANRLTISATDAAEFFTCPQYFKLKSDGLMGEYSQSEYKKFSPIEFGNIVHKILSYLPFTNVNIKELIATTCNDSKILIKPIL